VSERIENIKAAVEKRFGRAQYVAPALVKEIFHGETVWEGVVETFDISLNPTVKRAYGFMYREGDETRFATVAHTDHVNSPEMAVKAFIASRIET
jgi:hypothetical protein